MCSPHEIKITNEQKNYISGIPHPLKILFLLIFPMFLSFLLRFKTPKKPLDSEVTHDGPRIFEVVKNIDTRFGRENILLTCRVWGSRWHIWCVSMFFRMCLPFLAYFEGSTLKTYSEWDSIRPARIVVPLHVVMGALLLCLEISLTYHFTLHQFIERYFFMPQDN